MNRPRILHRITQKISEYYNTHINTYNHYANNNDWDQITGTRSRIITELQTKPGHTRRSLADQIDTETNNVRYHEEKLEDVNLLDRTKTKHNGMEYTLNTDNIYITKDTTPFFKALSSIFIFTTGTFTTIILTPILPLEATIGTSIMTLNWGIYETLNWANNDKNIGVFIKKPDEKADTWDELNS